MRDRARARTPRANATLQLDAFANAPIGGIASGQEYNTSVTYKGGRLQRRATKFTRACRGKAANGLRLPTSASDAVDDSV
jgi:hypothetical protein